VTGVQTCALPISWDLDLLGHGASSVADVVVVLRSLCAIRADDGIEFDSDSVSGEQIRIPDEYNGVRVRLEARLAEAREEIDYAPDVMVGLLEERGVHLHLPRIEAPRVRGAVRAVQGMRSA
jgi:hypothetical protein